LIFAYTKAAYKEKFKENWQGAVELALEEMIADLATGTNCGRLR
jgi:hypothetical protein